MAAAAAARRSGLPGDFAAALDRYTGDLLPDDRYEGWALAYRAPVTVEEGLLLSRLTAWWRVIRRNGPISPEAAEVLVISGGTLRRHLARLRARRPALYAVAMQHRAAQLDARHEVSQRRRVAARATYRAEYRAAWGREPWARATV